jgi:hypothetical protein
MRMQDVHGEMCPVSCGDAATGTPMAPPRRSCVCMHRACVRTALIKQISTRPLPKWSLGVLSRQLVGRSMGVRSVLLVLLAVMAPGDPEPSDWVSTTTGWAGSYGREILTGWLSSRLPTVLSLASERGASLSGLARGVAQKRREPFVLKSDMPAAVLVDSDEGDGMVSVMIGIDPHKASHTAAAIDSAECELGQIRVREAAGQVDRLLAWAEGWPERTWAVENAGGLGYLLAQQLLAAGERVLDVPPKLAARVRLLATGDINKNDPNDARSVAVAALRSPAVKPVGVEDHQAVMKLWAKRHRDLGRSRTQLVCRLYAVLCELVPGGGSPKNSAPARPKRSSLASSPKAQSPPPATSWPKRSSTICAASTNSCATPRSASPPR